MGTDTGTGTGTSSPFPLWMTNAQACQALGIGPRALRKRVAAGLVERRTLGREGRYRVLPTPAPGGTTPEPTPEHRNHGGTRWRNSGTGAVPMTAPEATPEHQASPELVELARLVESLTASLASSERERGEAIGIGHALADERDRALVELAELRRNLLALASSSRAWPLRRRLLALVHPEHPGPGATV